MYTKIYHPAGGISYTYQELVQKGSFRARIVPCVVGSPDADVASEM